MKHFQISAEAFIGWNRIARPGSVLGPQQYYLPQVEHKYVHHSPVKKSSSFKACNLEMSPLDKLKSVNGEFSQGNYLIQAKERHSEKKNPIQSRLAARF